MTSSWTDRLRSLRDRLRGDDPGRAESEDVRSHRHERATATLARHPWPEALRAALDRLSDGDGAAYLVGGSVRDGLLGRAQDATFDVATDRTPDAVTRRFDRVEPIGIAHGTVLVLEGDVRLEVTTFRREGPYADARRPDHVTFTRDVLEDLSRRDLTVNALAFDPARGLLLDPHGGVSDLERGVLRAVGDPVTRFREDALRPLRVARLAATLEMAPEPATRAALSRVGDRISGVAIERVRDEWRRMLAAPRPSVGIELLREAGLVDVWMPELMRGYGVVQNRWHAYDVYDHLLHTCDAAPADKPRVRWAALLHDIGKPETRVERDGEGTFYRHEIVGAEIADEILQRFRFPNDEREAIVHLVREHMFNYREQWTDAALRRWLRRVGTEAVADLFDLRIADLLGNGSSKDSPPTSRRCARGSSRCSRRRRRSASATSRSPVTTSCTSSGSRRVRASAKCSSTCSRRCSRIQVATIARGSWIGSRRSRPRQDQVRPRLDTLFTRPVSSRRSSCRRLPCPFPRSPPPR
jgi:tRNA nucleotidyltransferase (CCA-adding enzyme)